MQRLAQRETAVFDRVVFVDVGIAGAGQGQREAAVAADLLQHVVEEAEPGGDFGRRLAVEVHRHPDPGLLGDALDAGGARRVGQQVRQRGPIEIVGPELEAAHAEVAREFNIGVAVADHRARGEIQVPRAQIIEQHADAGLAGRRIVGRAVFVEVHRHEADALRGEHLLHQALRRLEGLARKARRAESVLVADDHELEAGVAQLQQRGNHAIDQRELLQRIDLLVRRLGDQGAVAVEEQDAALGAHAASRRAASAASTASFSAAVPIDTRRHSARPGWCETSRSTMPRASSAR